jgi:ABC-2 type transport system ATP-binding protein
VATASGDQVMLRTTNRTDVMTVLANAGGTVATTDRETVTVRGLPPERIIVLLNENGLPFTELAQHRASLEEAYMELTRDAVEFTTPAVSDAS